MSRRHRRQPKTSPDLLQRLVAAEVERRLARQQALPPAARARPINQDALLATMTAQQAPAAQGTPMFAPGAPMAPQPGMAVQGMPRTYQYPVGYNIAARPRSTESTSFDTLRSLAMLYDGIQLCEQVWLDTVAKLTLTIKPRDEIIAEQGKSAALSQYSKKIRQYQDFFAMPDVGNGYDLKSWLRAAVRDQLQLDAVAIYVRRNKAGGVYSLELVDGSTVKPLIDPRGRRPQPPYPAYEQFVYGVPAGLYTSEELLYQRETTRTESVYGLSRVERIILRINQALRKENKDLARFTDGNVPPGILTPPDDGSQWTPEQLLAYQDMWDALLAGNDQARSRIRVIQPGSQLTSLQEQDVFLDFDRFLLNVTAACYSMTMADLGFTENVNKSSGESQENVFYRRAVQPLMDRYATLFTWILRHYFGEQDLVVTWSGFEESEDFNAMAASYVALTNAGITSPTVAAHQMNLPWSGPDIPNYVLTKEGMTFLEDAADPGVRKAANAAKLAGFAQAQQPSPPAPAPGETAVSAKSAAQHAATTQASTGQQSKGDEVRDHAADSEITRYNENHDAHGKFATGSGSHSSGSGGGGSAARALSGLPIEDQAAYIAQHGGDTWENSLTGQEWEAIGQYTHSYYGEMNAVLRTGDYPSSLDKGYLDGLIADATSGLVKSHAPADMLVARHVDNALFAAFQANVGRHFVDRGFCSTTLDTAMLPDQLHLRITVPRGTPGAYVENISRQQEYEWLLPPNAKFSIGAAYTDSGGTNVVEMTYVGTHQWH